MGRIEKPLPADYEAEAATLGSILLDPALLPELAPILEPADFAKENHGLVYAGMLALEAQGVTVDPLALDRELERRGQADRVGWAITNELIAGTPTSLHGQDYAKRVAELARRRRWITGAGRLATAAYSDNGDADPLEVARDLIRQDEARRSPSDLAGSSWADLGAQLGAISWAWPGWMPNGFLTLLAGEQETGKSILALRMAASVTRGDPWPDGQPYTGELGAVLWAEAEAGQVLNRARAEAWGLPLDRILSPLADPLDDFRLDRPDHLRRLQAMATDPIVKLVILDSLSGAHGRRENDSEMLPVIKTLAELARNNGRPVQLTHHLRKRSILDLGEGISLDRIRGSGAITQVARAVWCLDIPDPNSPARRRLSLVKCNLTGTKPKPIGLQIDDTGVTFGPAPEAPRDETKLDQAIELLQTLLDDGPMAATAIEQEAQGAAISWATVRRAKDVLHVVAHRLNNRWVWALPAGTSEI